MDEFIRKTLATSVAHICDNIGWHAISDSSMNILTDILHHYINDLAITSKKYAEHAYSDVPDIADVEKAFRQKSISLTELRRYLKNTGPVKFPHSIPKLNIPGRDVLNALKPGSREIVTRPIHIHEHLPTLYTEPFEEEQTTDTEQVQNHVENRTQEPEEVIIHKRLREVSSVVMTSGGFLSPSREGRLAESKLLPFPEIKNDNPLDTSKISVDSPSVENEPPPKISKIKKKIRTKKIKLGIKKKQKGSKSKNLVLNSNKPKTELLKKVKKPKEDKILVQPEPVIEPVIDEIDVVNITDEVKVPKKVNCIPQTNKHKVEEVLPKFSFFGPLPQTPGLIPSTFSKILNTTDKTEKLTISVLKAEKVKTKDEDISHKEQKKKKKDKKRGKKEKKKPKDKEKEKKKEKLKFINKIPKIKLKFGSRMETITKVLPIEKPPEEIIAIISEPEPMEVDVDVETKSEISIDELPHIESPPKIPPQKIKTKIVTKITQPIVTPVVETPPPPAFYFDEDGNQVWICPMCTKPDDGSPMIGCDGCDVWYHWVCVGIQCPPDCAVWYCPKCLEKRAQPTKGKRGRPRKNKC